MKLCPKCRDPAEGWKCPCCGWEVEMIEGFPAFSPMLARENEGFKPGYFPELAKLEEANFWFRARNRLIFWAIRRHFPNASKFMEVGCGTGYVLSGVSSEFPEMELWGSEIHVSGLGFAASRVKDAHLVQMDAREMPFREEFDLIGAFDVLEHIEEDEVVLEKLHDALKAGGGIMLTVPQHPFLWSEQDVAACHVRRYTKKELEGKLEAAGFEILRSTSFVSLLFPLMMASRLLTKQKTTDPMSELRLSNITNALFESVMNCEATMIKLNFSLPFGGSLLLVGKKT